MSTGAASNGGIGNSWSLDNIPINENNKKVLIVPPTGSPYGNSTGGGTRGGGGGGGVGGAIGGIGGGRTTNNTTTTTTTATATTTSTTGTAASSRRRNSRNLCIQRFCGCFLCCCGSQHERKRQYSEFLYRLEVILKSSLYRFFALTFSILLLFGAQIKNLWVPKSEDLLFDILFCMTVVFFLWDMTLRIFVYRNYFEFRICCCTNNHRYYHDYTHQTLLGSLRDRFLHLWGNCRIGSFLFWCDVVSVLSLLYEISWINPNNFQTRSIGIVLNDRGLPISGLDAVNQSNAVFNFQNDLSLLVTIGKTARIARFVRSSKVSSIAQKINWYWFLQNCSINSIKGNFQKLFQEKTTKNNGRKIWDDLAIMLTTTIRTNNSNRGSRNRSTSIIGALQTLLEKLGILSSRQEELRRQLAATKIQRAWRAELRSRKNNVDASEHASENNDLAFGSASPGSGPKYGSVRKQKRPQSVKLSGAPGVDDTVGEFESARSTANRVGGVEGGRSQVGSAMRELTGQRVAIGIILALVLTVIFTYGEHDATRASTMVVLHTQTQHPSFARRSIDAARRTSTPQLYLYQFADHTNLSFPIDYQDLNNLRDREIMNISVTDHLGKTTVGLFAFRKERKAEALVEVFSTIFILLVWLFGIRAFVGPVMILVVIPIERMVRLLGMLTIDPLGYQGTSRYKKFVTEEQKLTKNTRWTKEVLKGMETSFLMSTILRIGSLMKVGFGSAGVEIIRNNLAKGTRQNQNILSSKGTTVSCIFLFCDIRQFTDATESLQEEVFRFTNRIAAVVHYYCHAYGGAANKNVGDAFLLSWLLDESTDGANQMFGASNADSFTAKNFQADKALYSVVLITIALQDDDFYLETLSEAARNRLLEKLSTRKGPTVQMGCGLHAGTAVQGAIGSERKIDATYVSEAVEMAEFLESSTKKYGVKVLMSNNFHRLLDTNNRRRCRKVDQLIMLEDDYDDLDEDEILDHGEVLELYTFDMDLDALNQPETNPANPETIPETNDIPVGSKREVMRGKAHGSRRPGGGRRFSLTNLAKPSELDLISEDVGPDGSNHSKLGAANTPGASATAAIDRSAGSQTVGVDRSTSSAGPGANAVGAGDANANAASAAAAAAGTGNVAAAGAAADNDDNNNNSKKRKSLEKVLRRGPNVSYNHHIWNSNNDIKAIRKKYTGARFPFFQKFSSGLQFFYAKDWKQAKQCFAEILDHFEDGPSRYFMNQIESNKGRPPPKFISYGRM